MASMANGIDSPPTQTPARISSFEKKPPKNGTPASDSVPMRNTIAVWGIVRTRPPMRKMSLVPTAWMTAPAPRKSSALKTPCVSRWRNPAHAKPAPIAAIM